jgi:hypothetical protein
MIAAAAKKLKGFCRDLCKIRIGSKEHNRNFCQLFGHSYHCENPKSDMNRRGHLKVLDVDGRKSKVSLCTPEGIYGEKSYSFTLF